MKTTLLALSILTCSISLTSCNNKGGQSCQVTNDSLDTHVNSNNTPTEQSVYVGTKKTTDENLIIYTPEYSKVDLVCGTMPSVKNTNVIYCAEAAFTGDLLEEFKHSNIAGDHVSGGVYHKGYGCKRNTGAFVYYNGKYKFLYKNYSDELKQAEANGGMGFGQELMIHNGEKVKTIRKADNMNEFRALCELDGRLAIIDANGTRCFGDFIEDLLSIGVTEAIYLDMGLGWNFSWWRDNKGKVHYIHEERTAYTTNWITFYR